MARNPNTPRKDRDHVISAWIPADLHRYLKDEADARGTTRSELLKEILSHWYFGSGRATEPDAMRHVKQLFYQWMRVQLGTVFAEWTRDIPRDYDELKEIMDGHRRVASDRRRKSVDDL